MFSQDLFKQIENAKTGNFKDALYNIIQLSTKNLSEKEKTLELNSTLFKIMYNADISKLSDLTIEKSYFLRNFQINTKANFDENYKYTGFSGGFTFAIVNDRDSLTINLARTLYGKHREEFIRTFQKIQSDLAIGLRDEKKLDLLNKASEDIINATVVNDTTGNPYYTKIQTEFKKISKSLSELDDKAAKPEEINEYVAALNKIRKSENPKLIKLQANLFGLLQQMVQQIQMENSINVQQVRFF
ncbi:hypothetical protein [Flavobacterium marginilacus]|uniref:hypothetical protein n=1 Tax=Flavobacterium marginilacus TaxID=3003256 RepID=UPI00248E112D|nr:hypothetical protein [Flavobacterium marginilacus]